jgi:ribulose 1,5-bisphosphate synthetase/thiazole synthase
MAQVWTPLASATSLWASTAEPLRAFPSLSGEVQADVVIIGAGYTGLSAALHLAEQGRSVLVLDAHEPGWGASGRNNGQVIPTLTRPDPEDIVAKHRATGEHPARSCAPHGRCA